MYPLMGHLEVQVAMPSPKVTLHRKLEHGRDLASSLAASQVMSVLHGGDSSVDDALLYMPNSAHLSSLVAGQWERSRVFSNGLSLST